MSLEKRQYVYRKSYKYYFKIGIGLSIGKIMFCTSGLSGFALPPLTVLSLGAGIIEILDRSYSTAERIEEYKMAYKFYKQMLLLYKGNKLTEEEINMREYEFIANLKYLPREKYLKEMKLNGYT